MSLITFSTLGDQAIASTIPNQFGPVDHPPLPPGHTWVEQEEVERDEEPEDRGLISRAEIAALFQEEARDALQEEVLT